MNADEESSGFELETVTRPESETGEDYGNHRMMIGVLKEILDCLKHIEANSKRTMRALEKRKRP